MGEKTKRTAKKSVFPSDAEWGMTMRDDWGLPQIARSNTDAIRGAFIKKHETPVAVGRMEQDGQDGRWAQCASGPTCPSVG